MVKILTYKKWIEENEVWLNSLFVSIDGKQICSCRPLGNKIHKSAFDDMCWYEYKVYKSQMKDGTGGW